MHVFTALPIAQFVKVCKMFGMKNSENMFVFPGQGSQSVGMGQAFLAGAPERELLESVEDALKFKLGKLMAEGPLDELTQTQNTQPALMVCGAMACQYLLRTVRQPIQNMAACVAGHSLGEYTAVHAAGGLAAPTMARLVRLRGEEMAKVKGGAMVAVLGLVPEAAAALESDGITFANDNASGQAVFSGFLGGEPQKQAFEAAAKAAGAKRCMWLNVSGPFHTPNMKPAAEAVAAFLAAHPLQPLAVPCMMNATATAEHTPTAVQTALPAQVAGRVRWREGMVAAANAGITQVVELGAGKVLAGLASRCDARLTGIALDTPAAIDAWLETVA
jgi:[acyl-carrier-protein] S-malonyltransferase